MGDIGWINPADFFGKMNEREEFLKMRELDAQAARLLESWGGVTLSPAKPVESASDTPKPNPVPSDASLPLGGKKLKGRDLGAKDVMPSANVISSTPVSRPGRS